MERVRIADRMNRLPVTGFTKLVCACMFIGWMCEAIDLGVTSYMLPALTAYWGMTTEVAGWFLSSCFVGMLIGSLFAGPLADRIGRKPVIIVFMIVQGLACFALALAPSLEFMIGSRVVLGIGLGAQFPVAVGYISESLPAKMRGKYVAMYQLFLPIGMAIAALLVAGLLESLGWRIVYALSGVPVLWFIAVWKICPESALWLEARGRHEEADRLMSNVWEAKALEKDGELAPVVNTAVATKTKVNFASLFKGKQLVFTLLAVLFMFFAQQSDYGLTTWITTLFVSKGFTVTRATWFVFMGILGGIPAYFLAAWAVDKIGRKKACLMACVTAGVFGILYGFSNSEAMIIIVGFFYNLGKYAVAMCFLVYMPELFETSLRSTGNGLSSAGGRLGSIFGSPIMGAVFVGLGATSTFIFAAILVLVAGVLAMLMGPETREKVF